MITQRRINLWSSPRNISTALMYGFANRPDTSVVDEPLYAHYLRRQPTETEHPGREDVLASQEDNGDRVMAALLERDFGTEYAVFKQMTHHLIDVDLTPLRSMQNVLLIRDPTSILASFSKVIGTVVAEDTGIPQQAELHRYLTGHGCLTAVIDARRLLLDPPGVLRRLCDRLDIPFHPAMLSWPAGPRPEDGVWAPHWYANVHRSTGFLPFRERTIEIPERLRATARRCQPYYDALVGEAL